MKWNRVSHQASAPTARSAMSVLIFSDSFYYYLPKTYHQLRFTTPLLGPKLTTIVALGLHIHLARHLLLAILLVCKYPQPGTAILWNDRQEGVVE